MILWLVTMLVSLSPETDPDWLDGLQSLCRPRFGNWVSQIFKFFQAPTQFLTDSTNILIGLVVTVSALTVVVSQVKKIKCEKSLLSRLPLCGRIPCVENSFFYKILSLPSFMWKNPLCGKILFMKSNLPSFVWKKSPLWKNPFYKVQFTFLCVEKSLVWKSPL